MPVANRIASFHEEMTRWRHDFHAHPELGFQERRTSALISERLAAWGIEVDRGLGGTGVVGILRGLEDGPMIGLRADMDALPIEEAVDRPHRSINAGVMHACGHDGHITMLLGAARYLAETRNFAGTAVFIFQPAEEGLAGGKRMVDEGLFRRYPVDRVFAAHNWPDLPFGQVGVITGAVMAAADRFDVVITGHGGHGAMPHRTTDPILAAAHIITALQSLVSRGTDPVEAAVVSVTQVNAGSAYNIIPGVAKLSGTVRALNAAVQDRLETELTRVVTQVAAALGATARVDYHRGYPVTISTGSECDLVATAAGRVLGSVNIDRSLAPSMAAEDFSYMLQERPGCYFWIGQGREGQQAGLHNATYDFDDALLPMGAGIWAELVEAALPCRR